MSAFRAVANTLAITVSAVALTTACAAGQHAATSVEKPTLDGTQGHVGTMQLDDVSLQAPMKSYAAGANVAMTLYLTNNGHSADALTGVSSALFSGWAVVPTSTASAATAIPSSTPTPQSIPAGGALGLGLSNLTPTGGASAKTLVLSGLVAKSAPLYPGTPVSITFTFAKAGDITLSVPVQVTAQPNTQTLPNSAPPSD